MQMRYSNLCKVLYRTTLRATDRTYRKSDDRIKISNLTFFNLKHLCGERFSKITFISSAVFLVFLKFTIWKVGIKLSLDPRETLRSYTSLARSCGAMETTVVLQIISCLNHPFRYLHVQIFLQSSYFKLSFRLIENANRERFKVKVKFSLALGVYIYSSIYFRNKNGLQK